MTRAKKMICHDCGTIFNRKPQNGHNQVCWNCQSTRVTLVTDKTPPPTPVKTAIPTAPVIPKAPDPKGLTYANMPKPVVLGGPITPQMLLDQKKKLKHVVKPPVVLPGPANSPIARGVRMLAHIVENTMIPNPEVEVVWRERGSTDDRYAYGKFAGLDVGPQLKAIAEGRMNGEHSGFNDSYFNNSKHLPTRKGPRMGKPFMGIAYFEYGWKRAVNTATCKWGYYSGGIRHLYDSDDNKACNAYLRNVKGGQIFSERLVIAETGEIFYTPDHYGSFFRYHPGTRAWYPYKSAGGAGGPQWDESFWEPKGGR